MCVGYVTENSETFTMVSSGSGRDEQGEGRHRTHEEDIQRFDHTQ